MEKIQSKDGTTVAFDQLGEGPAMILVAGGGGWRTPTGWPSCSPRTGTGTRWRTS